MNQSSKPLLCCSESDPCMCNLGVSPEVHMTLCCCFFKALLCGCSGSPSLAFRLESGALTSSLYYILSTAGSERKDRGDTERGKNATSWTVEEAGKIMIPPRVLAQRLRYSDAGTITASSASGAEDNGKHKKWSIPHSVLQGPDLNPTDQKKRRVLQRSLFLHLVCTLGVWSYL